MKLEFNEKLPKISRNQCVYIAASCGEKQWHQIEMGNCFKRKLAARMKAEGIEAGKTVEVSILSYDGEIKVHTECRFVNEGISNRSLVLYFVHEAIRYFEDKYGWKFDLTDLEQIEMMDEIADRYIKDGGMKRETPDAYIGSFVKTYLLDRFPYETRKEK